MHMLPLYLSQPEFSSSGPTVKIVKAKNSGTDNDLRLFSCQGHCEGQGLAGILCCMAREQYRFRVITVKGDDQDWTPVKLRDHLERLTLLTPEVLPRDDMDLNSRIHTGFEVRIQAERDVARVFYQTLKAHFRTEQL